MVPWKQSASLILLARQQLAQTKNKSGFDYATLLLKRSPNMRFAPNISAFPGGKLDKCDLSMDWPKYLSSTIDLARFARKKADIYRDIDHPYPGLVFRLCAIRETFEETGLLIAKSRSNQSSSIIFNPSNQILEPWREKIRHDASKFFDMCKEIQVEPDVHSLYEWCQYLAAAIAKVRFDTIFYVVGLPSTFPCTIAADDHETVSADWIEPDLAMKGYRQGSIHFLPPQIVELSRLANFRHYSKLMDFLSRCDKDLSYHFDRVLGICYKTPDAMLLVMQGDEHYPADASFDTPVLSIDRTLDQLQTERQNRLVMSNKKDARTWEVHHKNIRPTSPYDIPPLSNGWENV